VEYSEFEIVGIGKHFGAWGGGSLKNIKAANGPG